MVILRLTNNREILEMQAWKIEKRDTKAKFETKCKNCKKQIKPGDSISMQHIEYVGISNLQGVKINNFYVHSDCIIERM